MKIGYDTHHRLRARFKVLCSNCALKIQQSQRIDTQCKNCVYPLYNNVDRRKLKSWWRFLNNNYPNWIFCNLYQYKKGGHGQEVARFSRRKDILPDKI